MYGRGTYTMSAVKEIQATDAFYSLREDQKQCQSFESFESCMTKNLLDKMERNCGCIPFELMGNLNDSNFCNSSGIDCTKKENSNKDNCPILCEGIYADIRKEQELLVDIDTPGMKNLVDAYEKYKSQFHDEMTYPPTLMSIDVFLELICI